MRKVITFIILSLAIIAGIKHPMGLYWKGGVKALLDLDSSTVVVNGKKLDTGLVIPTDITYDGKYVWVCSRMEAKAVAIDKNGEFVRVLDTPSTLVGIAWDPDRKSLWVASSRKIYRISPEDGTDYFSFNAPSRTVSALDYSNGYLWATDSKLKYIYQFDPDTGWMLNYFPYNGEKPTGISYENGIAKIADFDLGKIVEVNINEFFKKKFIRGKGQRWKITVTQGLIAGGKGIKEAVLHFAIPKDRNFQKILKITPNFRGTYRMEDEQKILDCRVKNLKPGEKRECSVIIEAELYPVHYFLSPDWMKGEIPENVKKIYLRDGEKYDIHNKYIQETVKRILKGETNYYRKVRKIYHFVMQTLHYELAGGWNPAPVVLQRGSGSCSEYTFSFVALLRAAGIPARYVGSVVERGTGYDWVFHRWSEVYFPGYGWVPLDPQHGDSTNPLIQADGFGTLPAKFLVTTEAAGPLPSLGWTYNFSRETTAFSPDYRVIEIATWEKIK